MINVIGLGYIGLPTALMLAVSGNQVIGTDKNQNVVDSLNYRELTFKEEGLGDLFFRAVNHGIQFTSEYQKADVYIISVPTPYDKASKKVDTKYIEAAVGSVLEVCPQGSTVVIESTVSPGVIDRNIRPMVDNAAKDIKQSYDERNIG